MNELNPKRVLAQVAQAMPKEYLDNLVVVGSLAVAHHFFGQDEDQFIRTKDVDCLLCPHDKAQESGQAMATRMIEEGWRHRREGIFGKPRLTPEPTDELSAIRLIPPDGSGWFTELLAVPASERVTGKGFLSVELEEGYFGLPYFEFLSICAHRALPTEFGIRYARPEMMALANLLSHLRIDEATMSSRYEGRVIKRCNKDLGRILSIGRLAGTGKVEQWPDVLKEALKTCFPTRWPELAANAGSGFRELLSSEADFEEAHHTCVYGLLRSEAPSIDQLRATGRRILQDAIEPLERADLITD